MATAHAVSETKTAQTEQPSHIAHTAHAKMDHVAASFNPKHDQVAAVAEESLDPAANGIRRTDTGYGQVPDILADTGDAIRVISGPLINYRRTSDADGPSPRWHGSVLLVTKTGGKQPSLQMRQLESIIGKDSKTANGAPNSLQADASAPPAEIKTTRLYADVEKTFWCFEISVPIGEHESRWEYAVPGMEFAYEAKLKSEARVSWFRLQANPCG